MTGLVDVFILRENANDQDATVVAVHRESGSLVKVGEHIFDVETSKATQEVYATADGMLEHSLSVGSVVQIGATIATITANGDPNIESRNVKGGSAPEDRSSAGPAAMPGAGRSSMRMSTSARELAAAYDLGPEDFAGEFVTVDDVRRKIQSRNIAASARPAAATTDGPKFHVQELTPLKRDEIQILNRGAGNTMLSIIGVAMGMVVPLRPESGFFSNKILDLVVYEASRLMHKYPQFNASFDNNAIQLQSTVNAGVAIDDGKGVVVYGIERSDTKSLQEIQSEILVGVTKYAEGRLTVPELTRATFIITDLSALDVDFVFPLLPAQKSAILGITCSARNGYNLFLGFDHRITEGRAASLFLGELRDRLLSFAATNSGLRCAFCAKSLSTEVDVMRGRGLLRVIDRQGRDALCCYSCWSGW